MSNKLTSVKEALEHYLNDHVKVAVMDPIRLENAMTHILIYMGSINIRDVDVPKSCAYVRHRSGQGAAIGTIRKELSTLQTAANHCIKWRRIGAEEAPSIQLPKAPAAKTIWFYKDELQQLTAAAEGRVKWFILLAYYTAGRKKSIEGLKRQQIDLDSSRINLAEVGAPVTNKHKPIVPIATEIKPRLIAHLAELEGDYILNTPAEIRPGFDKAAKMAGLEILPERGIRSAAIPTPHMLRHSRATHLLQDGTPPFAVANLLGDSLQTVLKVYGHACPDYLQETL